MLKRFAALAIAVATMAAFLVPGAAQGQGAETLYGVSEDNALVRFAAAAPVTIASRTPITGLPSGESIVGIDFRPANGQLYGLANTGRLYTINLQSGAAISASALSTGLTGTSFGVDFNPVPDRLRIVSNEEQNLRVNVETGEATVDGTLAYAAGDRNAGSNPTVVHAAYTNSVAGATSTTLYVIDAAVSVLARQDPPNDGVLNTVGPLGEDASTLGGFDIAPGSNMAYATFTPAGREAPLSSLYMVDLSSGAATLVGQIGEGVAIRGLAVAPAGAPAAAPAAKPAAQPAAQPSPAPATKPAPKPAEAAKPSVQPAPAAKPVAAPVQMPQALPRTGVVEDWAIAGLAAVGAILLGAGVVARRRRA